MSLLALAQIETELPILLAPENDDKWQSIFIDYEPPHVERVWLQHGDHRIFLHIIHPCEENAALFHPHPWPSAMKILDGCYVQGIGWTTDNEKPTVAAKIVMTPGSSYEMTDINGWHYVCPQTITKTIMITGKPWNRTWVPRPNKQLTSLSNERKIEILDMFRKIYQL